MIDIYLKLPIVVFEYIRCLDLQSGAFSRTGPRLRFANWHDVCAIEALE